MRQWWPAPAAGRRWGTVTLLLSTLYGGASPSQFTLVTVTMAAHAAHYAIFDSTHGRTCALSSASVSCQEGGSIPYYYSSIWVLEYS